MNILDEKMFRRGAYLFIYFRLPLLLSVFDHRYPMLYVAVCPRTLFATKASEISVMPLKIA